MAAHGTTMALFLSVRRPRELQADLIAGGYAPDTPCAVVYRASWPDEIVIRCPLRELGERIRAAKITTQALVLVGPALGGGAGGPLARLRPRLRPPLPPARPRPTATVARTGARDDRRPRSLRRRACRRDRDAAREPRTSSPAAAPVLAALAPAARAPDRARRGPRDDAAATRREPGPVCVLASGDPGFFGIVRALGGASDRAARRPPRAVVGRARVRPPRPPVGRRARRLRPRPRPAPGDPHRAAPPEGRDPHRAARTRRRRSSPPSGAAAP